MNLWRDSTTQGPLDTIPLFTAFTGGERYDNKVDYETISDSEGLLPTQLEQAREFDPMQRFALQHIVQAIRDWNNLEMLGHVTLTTRGECVWTQEDEDSTFLWLCDDNYGKGEDCFVSLAMCCNAINISVEDVRAKLLGYGRDPEEWENEKDAFIRGALRSKLHSDRRRVTKLSDQLAAVKVRIKDSERHLRTLEKKLKVKSKRVVR